MKKVFLINTSQLPCPGSHYLHTIKFLKSFSYFGYEFIEIHKIEEVISYEDSPDNIFYIADHGFHINNQPNEIDILSRFKNSVFFLWHLHYNLEFLSKKLNKWILTGEHYRKEPESPGHKKSYDLQNSLKNYVPLTFAANSHPDEIKLKENFDNYKYDCNYVGCAYNPDWIGHIQQHLKCFIRFTPPFISEEDRINSFKDSLCSLGFQSPNNLINSCITERIFEALSYGCLLFVDSKFIADEIPNGVVYIKSPNEIIEKVNYFKQNGTYYHTCKNFLNKIKELKYND